MFGMEEIMKRFVVGLLAIVLGTPAFATVYYVTDGYFGTKTIRNYDSLIMTGGGGDLLKGEDYSVLEIQNTSPYVPHSGGILNLDLSDSSRLYFSGGQVHQFYIDNYATAVLSGGRIDEIWGFQYYSSPKPIEVICKSWAYSTTTKYLTGLWGNDSAFSMKLVDQSGYAPVFDNIKFTIIPEPMTLILLSLGGLIIRKK